jgi:hypothetical protein
MHRCAHCGADNAIVNLCRCDPANLPTKVPTAVYTFSNSFLKNGDAVYSWLRLAGLNPSWGPWEAGNISICLPEEEVPCLRMMQKANPARFGNPPEIDASLEETRRLNRADYAPQGDRS